MERFSYNTCHFLRKSRGKINNKNVYIFKNFDKVSKFVYNNHKAVVRK